MKWEACRAFYLFPNKFNKFNNTGAQMLDSIYHRTSKLNKNRILGVKMSVFVIFTQRYNECHYITLFNL